MMSETDVTHRTVAASRRLSPTRTPGRFFLGNVLDLTPDWPKYLAECEGKCGKTVYDCDVRLQGAEKCGDILDTCIVVPRKFP